jgi:hypothetical protein
MLKKLIITLDFIAVHRVQMIATGRIFLTAKHLTESVLDCEIDEDCETDKEDSWSAFDDEEFQYFTVPHIVWLDSGGLWQSPVKVSDGLRWNSGGSPVVVWW